MIPRPAQVTFGDGSLSGDGALSLAAQPFSGPPEISALLAELGVPVAGGWTLDPDFPDEEGYWLRVGGRRAESARPACT